MGSASSCSRSRRADAGRGTSGTSDVFPDIDRIPDGMIAGGHQAQREPVEITRHGRREFVLMSAEQYDWLTAAAKRTHRTTDATSVIIDAVERAEMDAEHAALDDLLK